MTALTSIVPALRERALLIGKTGSGKTELAKFLVCYTPQGKPAPAVYVLDTKDEIKWKGVDEAHSFKRFTKLNKLIDSKASHAIYAPEPRELNDPRMVDLFFYFIYRRQNCTVYVDEVTSVSQFNQIPLNYAGCLQRGRTRGIRTISASQTPKGISQTILSESEHFYIFEVQMPQWLDRIREVTGITEAAVEGLDEYEFLYARNRGRFDGRPKKVNLKGARKQ